MQFSKMHGLGNDFMVVDAVTQNVYFPTETIKRLADRHRGIGFDQLLVVEPPYDPELDFHYRIFNADACWFTGSNTMMASFSIRNADAASTQ